MDDEPYWTYVLLVVELGIRFCLLRDFSRFSIEVATVCDLRAEFETC